MTDASRVISYFETEGFEFREIESEKQKSQIITFLRDKGVSAKSFVKGWEGGLADDILSDTEKERIERYGVERFRREQIKKIVVERRQQTPEQKKENLVQFREEVFKEGRKIGLSKIQTAFAFRQVFKIEVADIEL